MTSLPLVWRPKKAARSEDSEFPPETSKAFTTGLQPQTESYKALPVPTLGNHHLRYQSAIFVQRSPAIPFCD